MSIAALYSAQKGRTVRILTACGADCKGERKINGFQSPEYNIIHGVADGISDRYDLIAANISADAVVELISGLRRF